MWLFLALAHFWKAENTWKTSLKMCKLFSVVNSTLASFPPSFETVYVTMPSETAKPIWNGFILLFDMCTIPGILFHEMTCLRIWWKKTGGDQRKLWNYAELASAATEALSPRLLIFKHTATFLRVTALRILYLELQPAVKVATVAQANQVNKWNNLSTWYFILHEITHLPSALRETQLTNAGKCLQWPFGLWNSSVYFSLFGHVSSIFLWSALC